MHQALFISKKASQNKSVCTVEGFFKYQFFESDCFLHFQGADHYSLMFVDVSKKKIDNIFSPSQVQRLCLDQLYKIDFCAFNFVDVWKGAGIHQQIQVYNNFRARVCSRPLNSL